jgi:hypothetical protein
VYSPNVQQLSEQASGRREGARLVVDTLTLRPPGKEYDLFFSFRYRRTMKITIPENPADSQDTGASVCWLLPSRLRDINTASPVTTVA